jgi:hypothetical protein
METPKLTSNMKDKLFTSSGDSKKDITIDLDKAAFNENLINS